MADRWGFLHASTKQTPSEHQTVSAGDSPQVGTLASKTFSSSSQCPPQSPHWVLSFWPTGSKSESSQSPFWALLLCSSRNSGRHIYPVVLDDVGKSTDEQSDTRDASGAQCLHACSFRVPPSRNFHKISCPEDATFKYGLGLWWSHWPLVIQLPSGFFFLWSEKLGLKVPILFLCWSCW